MARPGATRQYGKQSKKSKAERLFAELPQSPVRKPAPKPVTLPTPRKVDDDDLVNDITKLISTVNIHDDKEEVLDESFKQDNELQVPVFSAKGPSIEVVLERRNFDDYESVIEFEESLEGFESSTPSSSTTKRSNPAEGEAEAPPSTAPGDDSLLSNSELRVLAWDDVCPFGDKIEKIAEASYAEVYRVTNARGISIIKVIRLESPLKAQTRAQERSGLVDEEPRPVEDMLGELKISEWLADVPGFVVYKDRYFVRGRAPKTLLETHQAFHRRMKRKDPDRLQFYPSPSRYLDETTFLVVELGDAGTALEDFRLDRLEQLWDIFFLVAIALARAEDLIWFEHRDLHEGNLCIKQADEPKARDESQPDVKFGYSGIDITILDYGLSRAEDPTDEDAAPVAYDLEKDLSMFTSTHADQCKVYRQMRSYLIRNDRDWLPISAHHDTPYARGVVDGKPITWASYAPYTNVLWLAYLYEHITANFVGEKQALASFKGDTEEMWTHLNPAAEPSIPPFGSAADVVRFAVEAGWVLEEQLVGEGSTFLAEHEDSIIVSLDGDGDEGSLAKLRRSPRRR